MPIDDAKNKSATYLNWVINEIKESAHSVKYTYDKEEHWTPVIEQKKIDYQDIYSNHIYFCWYSCSLLTAWWVWIKEAIPELSRSRKPNLNGPVIQFYGAKPHKIVNKQSRCIQTQMQFSNRAYNLLGKRGEGI